MRVDHLRRIGALRRKLTRAGLPGLLVTHLPDVRYLCGFSGSSAALAITRRSVRMFTDGRYTTQATEEVQSPRIDVEIATTAAATAAAQWLAAQPGVGAAGFDPNHTSVAELTRLKEGLPARLRKSFFTPLPAPLVETLRLIKDDEELVIMRQAALMGCKLFDHILPIIRPGLKEVEVAAELEYKARLMGAEGMSFETIVASGSRSAMPHGNASTQPLPRQGFVTLDFGIIHKGYCSDMTRTVHLGTPTARERNAYYAVFEAQEAGVAAVSSGVSSGDVDEAARSVLRREGLAEAFSHSTGHGVGLEIHEAPRIGAKQKARLQAGMVVTIEPGVYLPGEFGVRIEDMVTVTRTGAEILTPATKALIELY